MTRLLRDKDTICATVTAPGQAGIAVVRVSGSNSENILRQLCPFLPTPLESHRVYYGFLRDPKDGSALDEVLVTYFSQGRSFTGEMTFEISCHGSPWLTGEINSRLVATGARLAERGEFTYRAFMGGRIDLVQAESVLDLIQSRSKRASQLALRQLQGGFSSRLSEVLQSMTSVLANLEANIDFSSEDIVIASEDALIGRSRGVLQQVEELLRQQRQGRILKSGYQVLLVGRPNAGKSSLLNAFAQEERAIVTSVPGTTRDLVEAELTIDGYVISFLDTAGLHETSDKVEQIGIERALSKANDADLIFYVVDGETGWTAEDEINLKKFSEATVFLVWNKADVCPTVSVPFSSQVKAVSARTGSGMEELLDVLRERLKGEFSEDTPALANVRHFEGLEKLRGSLTTGIQLLEERQSPDLIALELQSGLEAVHELLGLVYDDQVMDRVFQEFCIGK